MMALASQGRSAREGTRMGLWGAAQAIAAGFGGLVGAAAVDVLRQVTDTPSAFAVVFFFEACLFIVAAVMALRIMGNRAGPGVVVPGE
jgi:BCD family chlorophyll transporter-like MFS transporter